MRAIYLLAILLFLTTVYAARISPVTSGSGFLGDLHIDARVQRLCAFNTSMVIIFLAIIGFSIYAWSSFIVTRILGTIFIMATVYLFCQNEVVTFVVVALLVVKPLIFGEE